jgi:hypothetical protein
MYTTLAEYHSTTIIVAPNKDSYLSHKIHFDESTINTSVVSYVRIVFGSRITCLWHCKEPSPEDQKAR